MSVSNSLFQWTNIDKEYCLSAQHSQQVTKEWFDPAIFQLLALHP